MLIGKTLRNMMTNTVMTFGYQNTWAKYGGIQIQQDTIAIKITVTQMVRLTLILLNVIGARLFLDLKWKSNNGRVLLPFLKIFNGSTQKHVGTQTVIVA